MKNEAEMWSTMIMLRAFNYFKLMDELPNEFYFPKIASHFVKSFVAMLKTLKEIKLFAQWSNEASVVPITDAARCLKVMALYARDWCSSPAELRSSSEPIFSRMIGTQGPIIESIFKSTFVENCTTPGTNVMEKSIAAVVMFWKGQDTYKILLGNW